MGDHDTQMGTEANRMGEAALRQQVCAGEEALSGAGRLGSAPAAAFPPSQASASSVVAGEAAFSPLPVEPPILPLSTSHSLRTR